MDLVGTLSNQTTQERLQRVTERVRHFLSATPLDQVPLPRRRLRRRSGSIPVAATAVLASCEGDMRARDIHAAVEGLLGESVSASSVKDCLTRNAQSGSGLFERVGRGRYRLRVGVI